MNKELAKYLSAFKGVDTTYECKPKDPDYKKDDSELQAVLDEIFSVDPVSGLVKGDIAYYLSKDGNPQVKQWIEANLLQPRRAVSSNPPGVEDDLIVEMSRQSGESIDDYRTRIMGIYDSAKTEYEKSLQPVVPDVSIDNE